MELGREPRSLPPAGRWLVDSREGTPVLRIWFLKVVIPLPQMPEWNRSKGRAGSHTGTGLPLVSGVLALVRWHLVLLWSIARCICSDRCFLGGRR